MYHPRLYGAFYDMGLKYGTLLREKANFTLPHVSDQKMDFGLFSYQKLKAFYPELVDEIEGFAKGINDTPDRLGAFLLSLGIFDMAGQCSVFAYQGDEGIFVGRNYDMLFAFKKFTESSLIAPQHKYAYISQSDVFIGRSDGINEKGLFIAMSFVNGTAVQPGIGFHFIVRKVLEDCSNTQQAIQLIRNTTVSSANNFLIADRTGHMAVVESAPQKSIVRQPKQGQNFIYITNQFMSKEMSAFDRGGTEWSKNLERTHRLENKLRALKIMNLHKAKEILSDECICLDLKNEKFGTIWSVVADLNQLTIERAETKPKVSNYKPETRLSWWLNKRAKSGMNPGEYRVIN